MKKYNFKIWKGRIEFMKLEHVLVSQYLPYAKTTIVGRAIPKIDGLKPVQRRILYTMKGLGLLEGDKTKSQNIVGNTMTLHPNGDSSIYDAMVNMTTGYDGINAPLIESKGNFGKAYSSGIKVAASRYTEAKLAPICEELFDGINENAVNMVDNYDASKKEPELLPVKFPSVLVNNSNGIAVSISSYIPTFSLTGVCKATIGRLDGSIKDCEQLADAIGAPEFTTGGFLHSSRESLVKLCKTGKGSFKISGKVELYNNRIVITEVPYTTTVEQIVDCINNLVKDKKLQGVKEAIDETGLEGQRIAVLCKSGVNTRDILQLLWIMTPLRSSISFRTRVIINDRCKTLGMLDLIDEWIKFREECITRVYSFRLAKQTEQEHMLSLWEKLNGHIVEVAKMIASSKMDVAKTVLINNYKLDEKQADYVLDLKIKSLTTDNAEKALKKLEDIRNEIKRSNSIINDTNARYKLIISELQEIIEKYGTENRTTMVDEVKPEAKPEVKISDEVVNVILTREGYFKRLTTVKQMGAKFIAKNGDDEVRRWSIKNNEFMLVYDRFGVVHKVLVDDIDTSNKSTLTDKVTQLIGVENNSDIVWIDACGDYSKYFNIIYPNGTGTRVSYADAVGNRKQYKRQFEPVEPGGYLTTTEDKFFIVSNNVKTQRKKASYVDISGLGLMFNRKAFKAARLGNGDYFMKIQPVNKVPNMDIIDIERYNKPYCVSIGDDILWWEEGQKEAIEAKMKEMMIADGLKENTEAGEEPDTEDVSSDDTEGSDNESNEMTEW
jgi:DNA gyrase subunit A